MRKRRVYGGNEDIIKSDTSPGGFNIYYNAIKANNTNNIIPAEFAENRVSAILDDPSQYYLSVIRFEIPSSLLPLFHFPDPAVQPLKVSLTFYDAGLATNFIQTTSVNFVQHSDLDPTAVYTYQSFIDMINTAFSTCFAALSAAVIAAGAALPAGSVAPFIIYDPNWPTFFGIVADTNNYAPNQTLNANKIKIFFNYNLLNFFDSLEGYYFGIGLPSFLDFQVFVKNNITNYYRYPVPPTATTVIMWCESNTKFLWQEVVRILITTNTIPVSSEYALAASDTGKDVNQVILTDFEPEITGEFRESDVFQYYPQGPYRRIDMIGSSPLVKFDLKIWWQGKDGVIHPIFIPPHHSITVKILFEKREKYCF